MATAMSSASAAFNQTNMIFFFYVVYGEYVCLAPPACFVSLAMVSPNANTSTSKHFTCWEEDQEQGPPLIIVEFALVVCCVVDVGNEPIEGMRFFPHDHPK